MVHEVVVRRSELSERLEKEGVAPVTNELVDGVASRVARGYREAVVVRALEGAGGVKPKEINQ